MNNQTIKGQNNTIQLNEEQIETSRDVCQKYEATPQYLNIYYLMLGLHGLENWLKQYYLPLKFDTSNHSFLNEIHRLFTPFISQLKFGEFKGCLVITDNILSDIVEIPKIAVDSPLFSAHFYMATDILEETGEVRILGVLRRDEIIHFKKNIQLDEQGDYIVPISAFDPDFLSLHTYVQYLNPEKIPLAVAIQEEGRSPIFSTLEAKVENFLKTPQFTAQYIWQDLQLTWEETSALFENNTLLEQLKNTLQDPTFLRKLNTFVDDKLQDVKQTVINVFDWFDIQLTDISDTFKFSEPQSVYQFIGGEVRDVGEDIFRNELRELVEQKLIPCDDAYVCTIPFRLSNFEFELLIGVWRSPEEEDTELCSMLYVLKPRTKLFFPEGVEIKIIDQEGYEEKVDISPNDMKNAAIIDIELYKTINISVLYKKESHVEYFICSPKENNSSLRSSSIPFATHYFAA